MTGRSKQILVLTPRYPYPVIGGDRLRIHGICRELAKHHELTLLSLCETQQEMAMAPPDDGIFARVERVYMSRWRSRLNCAFALLSATPLQVAYYRSPEFKQRVDALLPKHDLCLAHLIRTGEYVRRAPIPSVLEMTDAISLNYSRLRSDEPSVHPLALVYQVESKRLGTYEREVIRDFSAVSLVSRLDAVHLWGEQLDSKVVVCSNGIDLARFPYVERQRTDPVIAFIGNMTTMQNLDACWYFVRELLPALRARIDCTFRIVGRIHQRDAEAFSAIEGVQVLGNVEDVAAAVGAARVGVAPIRIGAGVQNKVLEYMALGLPTVTSSIGWEGLGARPNEELLIADTPEQYVQHIERLWHDGSFAVAMARSARSYVERAHNWSEKLEPLVSRVDALLQGC
jgi:glycosyltransferase involved in cell wall biosynthesis